MRGRPGNMYSKAIHGEGSGISSIGGRVRLDERGHYATGL